MYLIQVHHNFLFHWHTDGEKNILLIDVHLYILYIHINKNDKNSKIIKQNKYILLTKNNHKNNIKHIHFCTKNGLIMECIHVDKLYSK